MSNSIRLPSTTIDTPCAPAASKDTVLVSRCVVKWSRGLVVSNVRRHAYSCSVNRAFSLRDIRWIRTRSGSGLIMRAHKCPGLCRCLNNYTYANEDQPPAVQARHKRDSAVEPWPAPDGRVATGCYRQFLPLAQQRRVYTRTLKLLGYLSL